MRTIMAIRTGFAGDIGRGMVNEPAHKCRRVMAIAAVGSGCSGYMIRDLASGIQSIVTGFTCDWVPRQYAVIEYPPHVVTGGVMTKIASNSNVTRVRMRVRR